MTMTSFALNHRRGPRIALALSLPCALLLTTACQPFELFPDGDDEVGETDDEVGEDGEEPPPTEGFRVFPTYLLQSIPATVTIQAEGFNPAACELADDGDGGYLCDTSQFPGPTATVLVDRDGFDQAKRDPELPAGNYFQDLEVHVAPEGGPPGIWSACAPIDTIESCGQLCGDEGDLVCAPTGCDHVDPENPLVTYQMFTTEDCSDEEPAGIVAACDEAPIDDQGVSLSIRCCCE